MAILNVRGLLTASNFIPFLTKPREQILIGVSDFLVEF